ncbi:hypothetical protein E4U13_005802 [Claviceps humidiphila]|uniref:Uncharacterized protein n=1 Tax=Claviceps humidiphila TaxID=1294629 RepID=A0A9P7PY04_9HYPO|nr:hypothetical protein E4U13_005802 [Claviceps humidiphila]
MKASSTNEKTAFLREKEDRSLVPIFTIHGRASVYNLWNQPDSDHQITIMEDLVSHLSRKGFKAFKDDNNDHTKLSDQWKNDFLRYEMKRRMIHHLTLLIRNETLHPTRESPRRIK